MLETKNGSQNWTSWLIYLMATFSFFSGWFFIAANHEWVRQNMKWLMRLNAPMVDIVAGGVIVFLCLGWLWKIVEKEEIRLPKIPAELKWCLLFILSAGVSIYFSYDRTYLPSIWNWLRYIVFVYTAYVVVPYFVINRENVVHNILYIWFGVGTVISVYGISSLFVNNAFVDFTRVSPFPIWGFSPLGFNHNQLAEALVAIIPFGMYFSYIYFKRQEKIFWLFAGSTFLMVLSVLLTLSRAAWIAIALETILAVIFAQKKVLYWGIKNKATVYAGLLITALVAGYMSYFVFTSGVVKSSNDARVEATKIVFYYLNQSPYFGFGPGSYMKILWDTRSYVMDFGEPLEAHGFLQKIMLEEGFVGFGLFCLFLIAVFFHLWKAQSSQGSGQLLARVMFVSAGGIVVFQLFNTEYYSAVMWMPIGVALAWARIRAQHIL